MAEELRVDRRNFLKQTAGAVGAATLPNTRHAPVSTEEPGSTKEPSREQTSEIYPRRFRGEQLKMISFPLGGVAAGSIGLGGRGQLVNWEIFNRPNKGFRPQYAFPSIWAQIGDGKPVARVLESRILPPYEGQDGLGSDNAPGTQPT